MKTKQALTLTLLAMTSTTAGCSLDGKDVSCSVSVLYNELDQNQKNNCKECGHTKECPDEAGETGEESFGVDYTCQKSIVSNDLTEDFCWLGDFYNFTPDAEFNTLVNLKTEECPTPGKGFSCNRSWLDRDLTQDHCAACSIYTLPDVQTPLPPDYSGDFWPLCVYSWNQNDNHPGNLVTANSMHVDNVTCEDPSYDRFTCPKGMYGVEQPTSGVHNPIEQTLWTCGCSSDLDCQPGAVCHAGWSLASGVPKPTLCTWNEDGSVPQGNGIAPDGPLVYELGQWADGLIFDGERVIMSSDFFLTVTGHRLPILNDDQQINLDTLEVTYVGPRSLFAHLGLVEGDTLLPDAINFDTLAKGDPIEVPIEHADGNIETRYVQVDWAW